jgi:hypothetical protein
MKRLGVVDIIGREESINGVSKGKGTLILAEYRRFNTALRVLKSGIGASEPLPVEAVKTRLNAQEIAVHCIKSLKQNILLFIF